MSRNDMCQASAYQQRSEGQTSAGMDLINMLSLKKGSKVLDLGCGIGNITKLLSDKVGLEGKVVAVDPDGERLKIAREKYSASNIEYIQADDKTFPEDQYDVIFANAVVHWIHDKEGLHKRVYNNLCPGGCFAFTTPDGFFPIPAIGEKLFDELVRPNFLHEMFCEKMILLKEHEYRKLALAAGFNNILTSFTDVYLDWENVDSYIEAMYGWFQGEFNPVEFDKCKLKKLKEEIGDGPVRLEEPHRRLYAIFTK